MHSRDTEIRRAVEIKAAQEVKIMQKVNHAHREAFREKFPGQVEHAMRLTAERLQAVLTKTESTVLSNPETWASTAGDIRDLSVALNNLHKIHIELDNDRSRNINTQSS